jgi:hypothetical protein
MKKYIFTESQIKKIIDNQLNEQTMGSATMGGTLVDMDYENVKPELISSIKTNGKFQVIGVDSTGKGIMVNGMPTAKGQIITPKTSITIPMSSYLYVSGMGLPKASISFGTNKLLFSGYVA